MSHQWHSLLLLSVIQGCGIEVKAIVNVHFCSFGDQPYHPNNLEERTKNKAFLVLHTRHLVVLKTEPCCIWVAAVVEEGHGGEDGSSHWNDVELSDVVVLQDALRHL